MTQARSREEAIERDRADLHKLGYAQELLRSMGGFSNFAISFSIISILTGAVILYDYGLAWAGTAAVLIGWPLVTVFVLAISASMGEIASAYPTAGGLYYWASRMKSKNWGWWTAWLNLIGQFAIVAGINYAAAGFINATIIDKIFGGTFNTVEFIPNVLNGQLVTMGILMLIQLALNIGGINLVSLLNQVSVWWHIGIVAAVVILIFLAGKPDQSGLTLFAVQPQDVAGSWKNNLGVANFDYGAGHHYPVVLAFFFSLLQANWTYTGYDASAHVAEETVGARVAERVGHLPVGCRLGDRRLHLPARADDPPAQPVDALPGRARRHDAADVQPVLLRWRRRRHRHPRLQPRLDRRRHPGGGHRDRDGVLRPLVGRLGRPDALRVQPRRRPARIGLAEEGLAPLPDADEQPHRDRRRLVAVHGRGVRGRRERRPGGGGIAIIIVTAISTIFLYAAYGVVIFLGATTSEWVKERVWSLGRLSKPIAWVAMFWIIVLMVLFSWPTSGNISLPFMVGAVVLLLIYYFAWARSRFKGPQVMGGDAELTEIEKEFQDAAAGLETA